jgi:2-polyprenyl-3-methyl-5-hydroxy-6-metoxy-1,4-benzoquinol methylase
MPTVKVSTINQKSGGGPNLAEYWEQRLTAKPTLAGVGHNGFGLSYNKWMYKLRRTVFLRHVRFLGLDLPNSNVLDIGSGIGFWLEVWQSLGVRSLTGSDITAVATRKIRDTYPGVKALQLNIASPSATETLGMQYDAISAIDMLYHIVADDDYATAIANMARSLKPGDYLVMTENLLHEEAPKAIVQSNRTLKTVTELLAANHLTVVHRAPVFVLMNYPVDTRSALLKRLWLLWMLPASYFELFGTIYGATLLPLDLLLTKIVSEGPSTEILICRKQSDCVDAA